MSESGGWALLVVFSFLLGGGLALIGHSVADEELSRSSDLYDVVINILLGVVSLFGTLASYCADLLWPDGADKKHIFFCGGCFGLAPWLLHLF